MAIIKFGGGIAGIRGTIAGTTFTANKSGAYAKNWSKGPNPQSVLQTDQRRALSAYAQSWTAVPSGDKANWDTWASLPAQEQTNALGDPYYLSGFQWYLKVNAWLSSDPATPHTTYPTSAYPTLPALTTFTATLAGGHQYIVSYTPADFAGKIASIFAALSQTSGPTKPPYRPRLIYGPATVPNANIDLWTYFDNACGIPTVGSKIFLVIYKLTTDGLRSAAAAISAVVT